MPKFFDFKKFFRYRITIECRTEQFPIHLRISHLEESGSFVLVAFNEILPTEKGYALKFKKGIFEVNLLDVKKPHLPKVIRSCNLLLVNPTRMRMLVSCRLKGNP